MLADDLRKFPEFASAVGRSLLHEALTDPDLLALTTAGLLLGSRSQVLKGVGIAIGGWYLSRRVDQYMWVLDSKMGLLAQVISESNPAEADDGH